MDPTQNSQSTPTVPPAPAGPTPYNTTPPAAPGSPVEGKKPPAWLKPFYIIVAITFIIIAMVIVYVVAFNKGELFGLSLTPTPTPTPVKTTTSVSGNILFQGYASEEAYLIIAERTSDSNEFKSVVTGLEPKTGAIPWTWDDAKAGTNYEIQAQLKIKGVTVQTSTSNFISAPASNVNLVMISNEQPPAPQTTTVAGTININGYIPTGANVVVSADTTSGSGGQTNAVTIPAVDDSPFSWSGAISGTSYDMTAQLVNSSGTPIASPATVNITAPSSGLQFNINSTAQPPQSATPAPAGLSGTIIINGSIPSNAYITLGTRVTGSSSFNQVGGNITAQNNAAWSWTGAQSGTSYDVQAYLWSNNNPYAQSQVLTVTAPSNGNTLTINAQQPTGAPAANTLSVSCNGQQSGAFQATINYNTQGNLPNAQSFNIIVTLASTGSQVLNTIVSPPNPNQAQSLTTTYIFTSGATYYAQYAYSTSTSGSGFSPLSPAISFSCR